MPPSRLNLVRSRCSRAAGPGLSARALFLGDRLLPPRLSFALCPPMLVQPGLACSSGGRAGQPAVDGAEDSGREWLVQVEAGAGHPESQLVRASEESEPRPLATTCVGARSPGRLSGPSGGEALSSWQTVCRQSSQWL